jgi:NTP pyrophosphatase (non-canonical NTP hydrolase)
MNIFQEQIKKFTEDRNWNQFHNPKDLLLGIVEEVAEIRNIIKWEQDPEILKKLINNKKEILADNIGDIYWFLTLLANSADIDIDQSIKDVIINNGKRFPIEKTTNKHTNLHLGGHDGQYQ